MSSSSLTLVSDLLGYASIASWLGAQFPQVLENIRQQSCEGLALPFLANWLAGDISNLIGCILTHQLPFQTVLATYFVFVDVSLVGQYCYYTWVKPPSVTRKARRRSIDRTASRYRTLSSVAANVAAAAALAAQQDPHRRGPSRAHDGSGSRTDSESEFNAMVESFHSEIAHPRRVSWSTERHGGRGGSVGRLTSTSTTGGGGGGVARGATFPGRKVPPALTETGDLVRGRSRQRDPDIEEEARTPRATASTHRKASRVPRKEASMVFLGVFALFSFGTLTGKAPAVTGLAARTYSGRVLRAPEQAVAGQPEPATPLFERSGPIEISLPVLAVTDAPSKDRILGRFFAWLCTTLYLTSRLPQIWKNYVRKSVQGLSMYLFIFAFLGNSFYVASILTSPKMFEPKPASTEFITESIPYLLGSGGTLIFDVTIITQSIIYRSKSKRRWTGSYSRTAEEERGLLSDDTIRPRSRSREGLAHAHARRQQSPSLIQSSTEP